MREIFGDAALSNSRLLPANSGPGLCAIPVTLPPGCERLETRPSSSGSPAPAMTIGMVVVAFLAWKTVAVPIVTITSTCWRTRSCARPGRRSQ